MGSKSDLPVMQDAADVLNELQVEYKMDIVSAHRTPERMYEYAKTAEEKGIRVIIAGAGGAAHLPGMVAALALSFGFLYQVQRQGGAGEANPVEIVPVQMNQATASAVDSAVQSYRAVSARNELVGVEDLGWRELEDGTLVREVQYDYVDTVDLLDEEDGTMIRMQVPRQEIVNVAYQVI